MKVVFTCSYNNDSVLNTFVALEEFMKVSKTFCDKNSLLNPDEESIKNIGKTKWYCSKRVNLTMK